MKNKLLSNVIIILLIITGLSLLLYPVLSNYLKSIAYSNAIMDYQRVVEGLEPESYADILARAESYNEDLVGREYIMLPFSEEDEADYQSQVRLPGTDVMGYVVIPKINVSLPIYHGTSDTVLQNGIGHLEGSSMPVGGLGTHAVLSGHRGLVSARLFTDLDRLVIGDTFKILVLGEVLLYEVDDISTVLPSDSGILQIDPEQDYCTLLTCTPYGVNSHRLLVRGHRIPTPEGESHDTVLEEVPLEDGKIFGQNVELIILIAAGIAVVLVSAFVIVTRMLIDKYVQRRKPAKRWHRP